MALTATQQILENGERNVVLKYTFGGTTGDVTALALVDASALGASDLKIMKVEASLPSGLNLALLWDATGDVDAMGINADQSSYDFCKFGGLVNTKAAGWTGDINLRSDGYTAAAGQDNAHVVLWLRKRGNNV